MGPAIAGAIRLFAAGEAVGAAKEGAAVAAETTGIVTAAKKFSGGGGTTGIGGGGRSLGEKLWSVTSGIDLLNRFDSNFPSFQHVIEVSVNGGPEASLSRVWALALSTAFGRYRQAGLQGIQGATLEGWWDITEKSVRCRLSYQNSGKVEVAQSAVRKLGGAGANATSEFIINGATQETVGDTYSSWLQADTLLASAVTGSNPVFIGGIPVSSMRDLILQVGSNVGLRALGPLGGFMTQAIENAKNRVKNALPDSGRLITTSIKSDPSVQPPAPSGDGLSRTSPFIALVSNALTDPGYLPASPPQFKESIKIPVIFPPSVWQSREEVNKVIANYNANNPVLVKKQVEAGTTLHIANDGYVDALPDAIADLTGIPNTGV